MIELQSVTKIFDNRVRAVDRLTFTVEEGEVFGLIGTSGCGKTTTLKMINRLIEPMSGTIRVDGDPVQALPVEQLRRKIGYVIQDVGLFPHYTIRENIAIVPRLLEWESARVEARVEELLGMVGLDPESYAGRYPSALSGGQQQRVGLARALAANPPVILMDEPFGALDPITKEKVRAEFKQLLSELDKTIVLVTHDVSEAFDLCDRVCLMDEGQSRQVGRPQDLLFRAADRFVSSFFDSRRFELELQTLTLEDLVDEFPTLDPGRPGNGSGISLRDTNSVGRALSLLDNPENTANTIRVTDRSGEAILQLDSDQILRAFNRIRERYRGKGQGGTDG